MSKIINLSKMSPVKIGDMIVENQSLKLEIVDNMLQYGGSFVKSLSECILRADDINLRKLVSTFLDYFLEYQPNNRKNIV